MEAVRVAVARRKDFLKSMANDLLDDLKSQMEETDFNVELQDIFSAIKAVDESSLFDVPIAGLAKLHRQASTFEQKVSIKCFIINHNPIAILFSSAI